MQKIKNVAFRDTRWMRLPDDVKRIIAHYCCSPNCCLTGDCDWHIRFTLHQLWDYVYPCSHVTPDKLGHFI